MKLNPQAVINAGSVSGGSGGGIQIGTNVPCGIKNTHRFENEQKRDEYFTVHFVELDRLKTIIVCGGNLQLWTGQTAQSPYDNTKWVDMTWVIQGEKGTTGDKGENGRGIVRIEAQISNDDRDWTLEVTYTDATTESLTFPIPDVIANVAQRLTALEVRWATTGNTVNNLDSIIEQGRYPVGNNTHGKPPMMANKGSADVYVVEGSIIQVVRSIDGGVYTRMRYNGRWNKWVSQNGGGSGGGGGLTGDQEAMLISLGQRLPEVSPNILDLNELQKQGRFCYDEQSANRPNGTQVHGSVDVHACGSYVLQIATSVDGVMFHRALDKANGQWSDWLQISDHTGGATIYPFPRSASVFTTAQNLIEVTKPGAGFFYIPWKYVIHDNYGCTPQIQHPVRQPDANHWWVCPKSGSYDMELLLDMSFIKTQATIPVMMVVTAWHRYNDGREVMAARYNMPLDVTQKNQKTKSAKLRINQMPSGEMIRWQVQFTGGSWSDQDNPDVSFAPFRTMLMVDEADFDIAKRIGALAYNTWANFQSKKGYSAMVVDEAGKARLNAVKWAASIESVEATPQNQ